MSDRPNSPDTAPAAPGTPLLRRIAPWLLPVALWAAATLFLGGDIGKNVDDYSINARDPVTGAVPSPFNPYFEVPWFWRPLHVAMMYGGGTLLANDYRVLHIFGAAMHGAAVFGLWRVLRQTCSSRFASAAPALLMLVQPLSSEVPLWYPTTCTSVGMAFFFVLCLLTIRFAQTPGLGWRLPALMWLVAMIVPSFYEQSATGIAALPALVLATAPSSHSRSRRFSRAVLAALICGSACVLYIALFRMTAPENTRGGAATMVKLHRLSGRAHEFLNSIAFNLWGDRFADIVVGSVRLGWTAVRRAEGVVWAGVILAAGITLLGRWRRIGDHLPAGASAGSDPGLPPARRGWVFLFGAGIFGASWLPLVIVEHQAIELRNLYIPLIGVCFMLAPMLDLIAERLRRRTRGTQTLAGAVGAAALGALLLPSVVGMVGWQLNFRERWRQDQHEVHQLMRLFPSPPSGAIFAPMEQRYISGNTGRYWFDRALIGAFQTPWSGRPNVQTNYRRDDLFATSFNPWAPMPFDAPDLEGVRYVSDIVTPLPKDPRGRIRIPWDRLIPFAVDKSGRVRLVDRIESQQPDGNDLSITPPLVAQALKANPKAPTTTVRIDGPAESSEMIALKFWEWPDDGKPVDFARIRIWGTWNDAAWLYPYQDNGHRSAMTISLPPFPRPTRLVIRATFDKPDLDRVRAATPHEIIVGRADSAEPPLGILRLDPAAIRKDRRWMPLSIELPASDDPLRLTVRVRPADGVYSSAGNIAVWITPGALQATPSETADDPETPQPASGR